MIISNFFCIREWVVQYFSCSKSVVQTDFPTLSNIAFKFYNWISWYIYVSSTNTKTLVRFISKFVTVKCIDYANCKLKNIDIVFYVIYFVTLNRQPLGLNCVLWNSEKWFISSIVQSFFLPFSKVAWRRWPFSIFNFWTVRFRKYSFCQTFWIETLRLWTVGCLAVPAHYCGWSFRVTFHLDTICVIAVLKWW